MAAASDYVENMVINSLLRGKPFTVPGSVYIALHTGNPNEVGANEVTTTEWPAYVRRDSTDSTGNLEDSWSAPNNGESKNLKQIIFPVYNGSGSLTLTHWSLFDSSSSGEMLVGASLDATRTIQPGDVFVVDIEKLIVRVM